MKITERLTKPTPPFFKRLRTIGIALAAVAGAILTAPVALPTMVITIAGYAVVAGSVATAISQLTTGNETGDTGANPLPPTMPPDSTEHSPIQPQSKEDG